MVTNPPDDLPCSTIVYRLILRRGWIDPDTNKVKADAFMRRPPGRLESGEIDPMNPRDNNGLSVFDSYRIGERACIETLGTCYGLATLHVGTLLDHGLILVRDPEDFQRILIKNAPFEDTRDAEQLDIAATMAKTARIRWQGKWKKN